LPDRLAQHICGKGRAGTAGGAYGTCAGERNGCKLSWKNVGNGKGTSGAFGFLRSVHAHRRDGAMPPLVGNSYGRMRTAGHAAPCMPPSAGADGGGAPTGVESGATCGRGGESHAASGQIALLAQLGQLSRLVNMTSQSRQNNVSASRIGPWHHGVPDSLDSGMAHPPRTPPPPASSAGGSGPDSWCCLRAGCGAGAGSGGRGDCAGGPSCGTVDHSAGRWWGRRRTHGEPVVGPWADPYAGANTMNTKIDKFC
jgi:hypothetical protein